MHVERPELWHREVVRSGIFAEMDMEKWVFTWMLQGGWVVMQVFHACERVWSLEREKVVETLMED